MTPSGAWSEAGVRVGKDTYRSFPIAGSTQRLALFAYPWDTPIDTAPVVFARNSAGTEATARFWFKIFPKKFRMRDLTIDDKFLDKVVNQIDPGGSGDLLTSLPQDQRGNAPAKQQDTSRICASKRPINFCGPIRFCSWRIRRWSRNSPMCAVTSTKARRWISKCIWGSIWR